MTRVPTMLGLAGLAFVFFIDLIGKPGMANLIYLINGFHALLSIPILMATFEGKEWLNHLPEKKRKGLFLRVAASFGGGFISSYLALSLDEKSIAYCLSFPLVFLVIPRLHAFLQNRGIEKFMFPKKTPIEPRGRNIWSALFFLFSSLTSFFYVLSVNLESGISQVLQWIAFAFSCGSFLAMCFHGISTSRGDQREQTFFQTHYIWELFAGIYPAAAAALSTSHAAEYLMFLKGRLSIKRRQMSIFVSAGIAIVVVSVIAHSWRFLAFGLPVPQTVFKFIVSLSMGFNFIHYFLDGLFFKSSYSKRLDSFEAVRNAA